MAELPQGLKLTIKRIGHVISDEDDEDGAIYWDPEEEQDLKWLKVFNLRCNLTGSLFYLMGL
jgi:hypothetical protein